MLELVQSWMPLYALKCSSAHTLTAADCRGACAEQSRVAAHTLTVAEVLSSEAKFINLLFLHWTQKFSPMLYIYSICAREKKIRKCCKGSRRGKVWVRFSHKLRYKTSLQNVFFNVLIHFRLLRTQKIIFHHEIDIIIY